MRHTGLVVRASQLVRRFIGTHRLGGLSEDVAGLRRAIEEMKSALPQVLDTATPRVHKVGALTLLLDPVSAVDKIILETGEWEEPQIQMLLRLTNQYFGPSGSVFMNVGAYFGLYSLRAMQSNLFTDIHAFEADAANYSQLQACLFLNRAETAIKTHHIAVSDKDGQVVIRPSRAVPTNRGGTGVVLPTDKTIDMRCAPLNHLVNFSERNITMKMDLEGHEFHAIDGMQKLFDNNNLLLQIEIYQEYADRHRALVEKIENIGMQLIDVLAPDHYFIKVH